MADSKLLELASTRLRPLEGLAADHLLIHEIYASIQGESTYAGLPCTFVRLTGCPLRCRWCDTPYAFNEGEPWPIERVLETTLSLSPRLVELTGGEPLAQPLAYDLMRRLSDAGRKVLIETSGAMPIEPIDPRVTIIMDVKCPGSGEEPANLLENLPFLKPTDELKFVVADRRDFEWGVAFLREHGLTESIAHFSPVFGEMDYQTLCDWIMETGLPLRFQVQLHKHVWNPRQRGV